MRTIDRLLKFVDEMEGLSPTERQVIKMRINPPPTDDEVQAARLHLYPVEPPTDPAWVDVRHPA